MKPWQAKDGLRPVGIIITQRYKNGATLTSGPRPSSGPGSGTSAAVAAGAPRGDHPQVVVARPVVVVVAAAADPMVAVAED
jgi:hypothetical protein